jgi:hypothetical protein
MDRTDSLSKKSALYLFSTWLLTAAQSNIPLAISLVLKFVLQLMGTFSRDAWIMFSISSTTWTVFDIMVSLAVADMIYKNAVARHVLRGMFWFFFISTLGVYVQGGELISRCSSISDAEIDSLNEIMSSDRADSSAFFVAREYIGINNKLCPNIDNSSFIAIMVFQIIFTVVITVCMFIVIFPTGRPFSANGDTRPVEIQSPTKESAESVRKTWRSIFVLFIIYNLVKFTCANSPIATLAVDNSISTALMLLEIAFVVLEADRMAVTTVTHWAIFAATLVVWAAVSGVIAIWDSVSEIVRCGKLSSSQVNLASECIENASANLRQCLESSHVLVQSDASGFCPNVIFGPAIGWIWMVTTLLTCFGIVYFVTHGFQATHIMTLLFTHHTKTS